MDRPEAGRVTGGDSLLRMPSHKLSHPQALAFLPVNGGLKVFCGLPLAVVVLVLVLSFSHFQNPFIL